ncbi:hypothetical protein BGZ76_006306, partial [Entomortierella beljakovae]
MSQLDSGLEYHVTEHPTTEIAPETTSADPLLTRRERSSSDSAEKAKNDISDPYAYMTPRLKSLVLWERPQVSGAVLGSSLALVLSCRW